MDPYSDAVFSARHEILEELHNADQSQRHMIAWFTEPKWTRNDFTYCQIARDSDDNLIALSCNKVLDDNTMKILCHYYVPHRWRKTYRSLQHSDIIPSNVQYAKLHGITEIWYSIHAFDQRHKRYAESNIRRLNGGRLSDQQQPYWNQIRFDGMVTYNHTEQYKFSIGIV